jgi:hypothetical protein
MVGARFIVHSLMQRARQSHAPTFGRPAAAYHRNNAWFWSSEPLVNRSTIGAAFGRAQNLQREEIPTSSPGARS